MPTKAVKYLSDLKRNAVAYAMDTNIVSAANFYNINRKTVSTWLNQYKKHGKKAFTMRKKRDDKQPKKFTDSTLKKIIKYKNENPYAKLTEIKEKFQLTCSLVLISNKLIKNNKSQRYNNRQKLTVTYRVIKGGVNSEFGEKYYQFNIHDSITDNVYFSFAQEKNRTNLCVFINFVIGKLKNYGHLKYNATIVSNLEYLKQIDKAETDYDQYVYSKYSIPLTIEKNQKSMRSKIKRLDRFSSKHNLLLTAFENTLLYNEHLVYVNPVFIEDMIYDLDRYLTLKECSFSGVTKDLPLLLESTLVQLEGYADDAKISFNFNKALDLYNRIYLTSNEYQSYVANKIKYDSLFKQAQIYYHLNDYLSAKILFNEVRKIAKHYNDFGVVGEVYGYLGLIEFYQSNSEAANKNFSNAMIIYLNTSEKKYVFEYYLNYIRRCINNNDFVTAITLSNRYLQIAQKQENINHICKVYGIKGTIYYFKGSYKLSEKNYLKQLDLARDNECYIQEAKALNSILNIYTVKLLKPKDVVLKLIDRVREISLKIKKDIFLHQSYHKLANYYYHNNDFNNAIYSYKKVILKYSRSNYSYHYIRVLTYLARSYFHLNKYKQATYYLNQIINLPKLDISVYVYVSDAYKTLGRIFLKKEFYRQSVTYFNKSRKFAKLMNDTFNVAASLKFLGEAYEKMKVYNTSYNYFKRSKSNYKKLLDHNSSKLILSNISYVSDKLKDLKHKIL